MIDDKNFFNRITLGYRSNKYNNRIIMRAVYFSLFAIIVVVIGKLEALEFHSNDRSDIEQQSESSPKPSDAKEYEPPSPQGASKVLATFESVGLAVPEPKDNTICCIKFHCVQLIVTETFSLYEWPNEAKAKEILANGMADHQAGSFTIRFKKVYNIDGSIKHQSIPSIEAYVEQLDKIVQ